MIAENRRSRAHVDVPLILMVIGLSLFGVLVVSIATYSTSAVSDAPLLNHIVDSSFAVRQCLYVLISPVILSVMMALKFDLLKHQSQLLYFGINLLLLVTWIFNRATGVKAWLDVIWGYTIQPSEFAKLSLILYMAQLLAKREEPMNTWPDTFLLLFAGGVPCVIILASGEMGSMMVMLFILAVMLYFSGVSYKRVFQLSAFAVLLILLIIGLSIALGSDSYRLRRLLAFANSSEYASTDAYQQQRSMVAIGSGGASGIGMFVDGSWSQLNYVPADWTDFIFATIGESFGFVGCALLVLTYLAVVLRMYYLARFTFDRFGRLVIIGVMAMMLFHVFENVAMTIGIMPVTGIPLPFISYGGSNMVTNMAGVGLVLNVVRNRSLSSTIAAPMIDQRMMARHWYQRIGWRRR